MSRQSEYTKDYDHRQVQRYQNGRNTDIERAMYEHDPQQKKTSLKELVIYSAIGTVLVGGTIFLVTKLAKKTISNIENKKALDTNDPAAIAKKIKMAFDNDGWWGTDEIALRSLLRDIPDKEYFKQVAGSYKKNYSSALTADMQEELTSTEYEEMMMIISSKPEKKGGTVTPNYLGWAKRLRAAVSIYYGIFPGTDEDAIKAVFLEIPTRTAFLKVKEAYQKEYGDDLINDLTGDLSIVEIAEYTAIIEKKPLK